MTPNLSTFLKECRNKMDRCITCGSVVDIYSSNDGTNSYEPVDFLKLVQVVEILSEACVELRNVNRKEEDNYIYPAREALSRVEEILGDSE